jgi:hypothetical protein
MLGIFTLGILAGKGVAMPDKTHLYVGGAAFVATLLALLIWPIITATSITGTRGVTTGI